MAVKLDMIGIVCADVDASLRFYRALGMDAPEGSNGEPYVECTLPGGIRMSVTTRSGLRIDAFSNWFAP